MDTERAQKTGRICCFLLAAMIFAIAGCRQSPRDHDSPQAVVQDYLLALQRADFERAHAHLSQTIVYPANAQDFSNSVRQSPAAFTVSDNYSQIVESSEEIAANRVKVTVREIYSTNALFAGDEFSNTFTMQLQKEGGSWKLTGGERFWSPCWGERNLCE